MPSGHGSSGGGGSHGGGSHFGGGHGGNSRPITPIHYMWHGRYYYVPAVATSRIITCVMTAIFMFIFASLLVVSIFGNIEERNVIIADRERYISMINYAEQNPEYQREGRVKGKAYNGDAGKWYYEYVILTEDYGYLEGYTYSVYSQEEIDKINLGDTIVFAVDENPVTYNTDSINMDYKNIPLENDGEYITTINSNKMLTVVMLIFVIIFIVSLVLAIRTFRKNVARKKEGTEEKDAGIHDEKPSSGNVFAEFEDNTKKPPKKCPYCGSTMKDGEKKCKNCGAER